MVVEGARGVVYGGGCYKEVTVVRGRYSRILEVCIFFWVTFDLCV